MLHLFFLWMFGVEAVTNNSTTNNGPTIQEYKNFAKYLLLSSNDFQFEPDSLKCTDIDPEKRLFWNFPARNEGVKICEICPNLPQSKFVNVVIDTEPFLSYKSTVSDKKLHVPVCFDRCININECVALSFDHISEICYIFNSTDAVFKIQNKWTTILIDQPTEIIGSWTYTRHSRIAEEFAMQNSSKHSFLDCIHSCEVFYDENGNLKCQAITYDFQSRNCHLFPNLSGIDFYYEYGAVTAFNLEIIQNKLSHAWRFIESLNYTTVSTNNKKSKRRNDNICALPLNEAQGNFFTAQCLTMNALGCQESSLGCQSCYYPEISGQYQHNLPICKNSRFTDISKRNKLLNSCYEECINSSDCIAVDVNVNMECAIIRSNEWRSPLTSWKRYDLLYPEPSKSLAKFLWYPQSALRPINGVTDGGYIMKKPNSSVVDCLSSCLQHSDCHKISYLPKDRECTLASHRIGFISVNVLENVDLLGSTSFFRKPQLNTELFPFQRSPGWQITSSNYNSRFSFQCNHSGCSSDIVRKCLKYCLSNKTFVCKYVSFNYFQKDLDEIMCSLYSTTSNGTLQEHGIEQSINGEIFTRILVELNLINLNMLPIFQEHDFKGCFRNDVKFTQSDLSNATNFFFETRLQPTSKFVTRWKRGFFGDLWNGIKKFGSTIVDAVKDVGNEIIDTAKGVANAVSKTVQGDFKGALKSIAEIPIVKDAVDTIKNGIEVGKAIASGDLSNIKQAALNFGLSSVGFIPVGGRFTRPFAKQLKKRMKGLKTDIKNPNLKDLFKKRNNKKSRKRNKQNEKTICRVSRGANPKKRRQESCNDKDDEQKPKCRKPTIPNVSMSLRRCDFLRAGAFCQFECKAGFLEKPSYKVACKQINKKKASYSPTPQCKAIECVTGRGSTVVIPVNVYLANTLVEVTMYVVKYDTSRKLPAWSIAYHDRLNTDHIFGRGRSFLQHPCKELDGKQPKNKDYAGSGWHKGHLTPAEPMRFSKKASYSANFFINVAPQDPYSNQGPWKIIEAHVSCFMGRTKGLVATGICKSSIGKLRLSNIKVPSCFWKMICYKVNGIAHVVGFLTDNSKASTKREKADRADQVKNQNPKSQRSILSKANVDSDLWLTAFKNMRPTRTFSVTPDECTRKLDLDDTEKTLWKDTLLGKKRVRRKARQTHGMRGCSANEMKRIARLLNIPFLSLQELKENPSKVVEEDEEFDEIEANDMVTAKAHACGKRVIGYYPSWGKGYFSGKQAQKLTHVVYAFLETTADGHVVVESEDPNEATRTSFSRLEQLIDTANRFTYLKLMFAVGGWENSQYFSTIARDKNKRLNFISSVLEIIMTFGFDGIDIDWEYPVTGGAQEGVPEDKANYVLLMRELRQVLDQLQEEEGREEPYLISFAGAAGAWTLDPGYDLPRLLEYADWVNVMTYDYFGAWGSKWGAYTGPPAPLYFAMPPRFSGKTNVDFTIKYYVCKLKSPDQVNMGVPFYGRFWNNVGDLVDKDFSMWRKAEPVNGKFDGGFVSWKDISEKYLPNPAFQKQFHDGSKTPYAWNPQGRIFLGYEDHKSLQYKMDYADKVNIGGLMVWAIDQDDAEFSMLDIVAEANICTKKNPKEVFHKCSPLSERRWWIWAEDKEKAGMCGRSAPLYKGYYPLCDPDDPGYSCCGPAGYCGSGPEYCSCPTCKDYANHPEKVMDEPIKPTQSIQWYTDDASTGKRGRCGREVPKLNGKYAICNPDDENNHCCSNGGYCGNSPAYCTCDGCIDFKQNPHFRYTEKKWWTWSDGPDKSGRCGPSAPKINERVAICDPHSSKAYCCSSGGYCGNSPSHCTCDGCINFKTNPDYVYHEK